MASGPGWKKTLDTPLRMWMSPEEKKKAKSGGPRNEQTAGTILVAVSLWWILCAMSLW